MASLTTRYFDWLQKDAPRNPVEKYPAIDQSGETSVRGIFVIGDLTGIPLLKLASESGKHIIDQFDADGDYQKIRKKAGEGDVLDFLIIGAGPAGIAAGLVAEEHGYRFRIIDSVKKFSTIINFPKAKPIYAEPEDYRQESPLQIHDGSKESLLDELEEQIAGKNLPIDEGVTAENIRRNGDHFEIVTQAKTYRALRVILAIGKSGNARALGVPGEDLPKVYNRLFDPAVATGHHVLVVGGGDSALETAIATAPFARKVVISYRRNSFARPKEGNVQKLNQLVAAGKIELMLGTTVNEIREDEVVLNKPDGTRITIENSMVFVQIGRELPLEFFKRVGIRMEGEWTPIRKLMFLGLLLFSGMLYFGKAGFSALLTATGKPADSWGSVVQTVFTFDFWGRFFQKPLFGFLSQAGEWSWLYAFYGVIGYLCFIGFVVTGGILLLYYFSHLKSYTAGRWRTFKYLYYIFAAIFFLIIYFGSRYFGLEFLGKYPGFWYGFLYTLTILIFGLRRINQRPTRYIKYQTWTLIIIQALPLFLLPEIILPALGKIGALGAADGFLLTQVFPKGEYWHAYRFILAWPLNIYGLYNDQVTGFWLGYSLFLSFGFIPAIVYRWGKGAYCGWICSCGALAETLGDEYRTLAPHGPRAKKWENAGQWVLLVIFFVTAIKLIAVLGHTQIPIIHPYQRPSLLDEAGFIYSLVVDVIFAGVLGVGVYFFLSGRVWCRFFCPLAALMHIYTRFSRYRIFSEKKKCISCNICTKVCHMGIDVMSYANRGIPMNDVECVRCSACIVNCPTRVIWFGSLERADLNNDIYREIEIPLAAKESWQGGL